MFDYILKYGNLSFDEEPFNEVDNVIFSFLTYVDYNGIVSINSNGKKTLKEVGNEFFNKYGNNKKYLKNQIIAVKSGIKVLDKVRNTKRFKDILVYNYSYIIGPCKQFSAITFEINPKLIYVAFEGTDQLLDAWEEDFKMAYKFPVEAHREAIKYLNKNFILKKSKLIVGGHSKGGNLALVSSMYCHFLVRNRIINIYSNDGPGLRLKQIESIQYKRIKDKLIHIIPNYSVVGLYLRHSMDYQVVKSKKIGLEAHNALNWIVEDKGFKRVKLSRFSQIFEEGLEQWLDKYDDSEREKFVIKLFDIFRENQINSLIDILEDKKNIIKILKSYMNIDKEISDMIKDLIAILNKCHLNYYINIYKKYKNHIDELVN